MAIVPTQPLTLRQIEIFRSVMRSGTLIGAARQLRVSQPTVTRTVIRIELALKVRLFERQAGRITPTADAHRILRELDPAFVGLEAAVERVGRLADANEGVLYVGSSPSLARIAVPRAIAMLLRKRPRLTVHFDALSVSQTLDYLISGPGGYLVTLFPIIHAQIRSAIVGEGRLVALVPLTDPLAKLRRRLQPRDLAKSAVMTFVPQSVHGQALSAFLGGIALRQTHTVRFAESAIGLAEAGVGVAVVDEFSAAAADLSRVRLFDVAGEVRFKVYLHRNIERFSNRFFPDIEKALRSVLPGQ